jgi:hypothetical protein
MEERVVRQLAPQPFAPRLVVGVALSVAGADLGLAVGTALLVALA